MRMRSTYTAARRHRSAVLWPYAKALTLRRVPLGDALKARADFSAQRSRAHYLCRLQFTAEGSKERRLMELVSRHAGAFDLLLAGGQPRLAERQGEGRLRLEEVEYGVAL